LVRQCNLTYCLTTLKQMPRPIQRVKGVVRQRSFPVLLRATRRLSGGRTVAVLEYPFTPQARWGWGKPPHPELLALLAHNDEHYETVIDGFYLFMDEYGHIPRVAESDHLAWDNPFWGGLDAVMQYASLCRRRPKRYLEVGSGYSTLFARAAIDFHQLSTRIVSIDPSPRAGIDHVCDEVMRCKLEDVPPGRFEELESGDILLIDGSHTAFMGSDSVVALIELFPKLSVGVLVGIDDIFLPWDYHPTWVGRWYGEQYVLAGMLLGGAQGWQIEFPGWYLTSEAIFNEKLAPLWEIVEPAAGRMATSFWMQRQVATGP
jgi:Methyltransferase domain